MCIRRWVLIGLAQGGGNLTMHISCPNCSHGIEIVGPDASGSVTCPTCGSEFNLLDDLEITLNITQTLKELHHFQLVNELGRGRFGSVWRAKDRRLNRLVAIKLPHNERLTRDEAELFLREARNAAQVSHPNIVQVYEVGRAADTIYIVSELIDGISLSEWRPLHSPDVRRAARICASVARALHAAHLQDIVHRDLKPGNIVMDERGEPHITDFGLAKRTTESTIAVDGQVLGTPAYMSPEQASGKGYLADGRSDIFALGVILYELLTHKRPFDAHSEVLLEQIRRVDPKPPRALNRKIPRDLETICLHAMEKAPADRYQTAADMADDLDRFLDGQPLSVRPLSPAARVGRFIRRKPAISTAIALGVLCILLAGWALSRDGRERVFVDPEARPVTLQTEPPGAEVAFIPLDRQSGVPWVSRTVQAGPSPVGLQLSPGDYLVVARRGDDWFHEVYRRVPGQQDKLPTRFRHTRWKMDGATVVLPAVTLFRQSDVTRLMARVDGATFDRLQTDGIGSSETVRTHTVPSFFVDRHELLLGDLQRAQLSLPPKLASAPPADNVPVTQVTWDEAVELAEQLGKRLLDEWEYEYLATAGGTRSFPWGEDPVPATNWDVQPVDQATHDTLVWERTTGAVHGLFSNAAEWTQNWSEIGPLGRDQPIVRGGPTSGNLPVSPLWRGRQIRPTCKAQLGFRCARSARPRLASKDFVEAN